MVINLESLTKMTEAQLPAAAAARTEQCRLSLAQADQPVSLPRMPLAGTLELMSADLLTKYEAGKDYRPNYLTGTVTPLSGGQLRLPTQLLASYQSSMVQTWLEMAVADLGMQLPEQRTARVPANHHRIPLPQAIRRIVALGVVSSSRVSVESSCNTVQCGPCQFTIEDCYLVADVIPAEGWVEICYMGGFVLDCDGFYPSLRPELADLVVLKALSLAYASPLLAVALSSSARSLSQKVSGQNDQPAGPIIAMEQRFGDEASTVRWASNSDGSSSSQSALSAASLRKSADHYLSLYQDAVDRLKRTVAVVTSEYCEGSAVKAAGRYLVEQY